MSKITHPEMVKQLAKSGADIIAQLTPNSAQLLHMSVGVAGEAGELLEAVIDCNSTDEVDEENLIEELGDIEFYLEGVRQEMGFKWDDTLPEESPSYVNHGENMVEVVYDFARLSMSSGVLLDSIKKFAIYVKPINAQEVMNNLQAIEVCIESIRQHFGVIRKECLEHNVNKLGKRYKGHSYSNEQAQDRADKPEES
jgi:NTP pyrophosphatase (non-canonical NTP hydrolase)